MVGGDAVMGNRWPLLPEVLRKREQVGKKKGDRIGVVTMVLK